LLTARREVEMGLPKIEKQHQPQQRRKLEYTIRALARHCDETNHIGREKEGWAISQLFINGTE